MLKKRYLKTIDGCDVTFTVAAGAAETAVLLCEFNEWAPIPMKKAAKGDLFKAKLRLPKEGRFQFRYLLDDSRWLNDEDADGFEPNEFGGQNGVVTTS